MGTNVARTGGKYWSIANYYVFCPTGDPNYPTCKNLVTGQDTHMLITDDAIRVSYQDEVLTWMYVDVTNPGCNATGHNCNWVIGWQNQTTWVTSQITITSPDSYQVAFTGVLEVYGVTKCTDLPPQSVNPVGGGIVDFVNPRLRQPGPNYNNYQSVTVAPIYGANATNPSCGWWGWAGDGTDGELGWNAGQ